jgi:glucosamine kinase
VAPSTPLSLGVDAGGTATRWLLADAQGREHARGEVGGFSATMFGTVQQPLLDAAVAALGEALRAHPRPQRVCAGLTGFDAALGAPPGALHRHLAHALGLDTASIALASDIELACRALFEPGRGILVIAGTGSIAAHLRGDGALERAGGRGSLLDDGGSGYWIAREALRAVWRREDEVQGAWQRSGLARALFDQLGGAEWARTREFVAGASRGEMGTLATAVAASAQAGDRQAVDILERAGGELARIANALIARCGVQPVALAGRVASLDARIVAAMRAQMPESTALRIADPDVVGTAARLAWTHWLPSAA